VGLGSWGSSLALLTDRALVFRREFVGLVVEGQPQLTDRACCHTADPTVAPRNGAVSRLPGEWSLALPPPGRFHRNGALTRMFEIFGALWLAWS